MYLVAKALLAINKKFLMAFSKCIHCNSAKRNKVSELARWLSDKDVSLWLADFPWSSRDLWLTCDHFVGKVSAIGQPTKPTQPSIPFGSVNE